MLLGLMAWFMQLVVFIQPLLPGGVLPGIGVCMTIVDAIPGNSQKNDSHHQHHGTPHHQQHMHMDMPMPYAGTAVLADHSGPGHAGTDQASKASSHASADHYLSHLSCGFCSLFGHALPAALTAPVWLEAGQRVFVTLPPFTDQSIDILKIAYLHPKSRAPPFAI